MKKVLSVIIPSYNMEKYLDHCLSSLVLDNMNGLDVIVVNDGSKDKTFEIALEYQKKYPDVFRVINKTNGNYGSCINAALPVVKGTYVKILDADDSFDTKNFAKFIDFLAHTNADLILTDFEIVNEERKSIRTIHYNFPIKGQTSFLEFCTNPDFINAIQMHAVTYRHELLISMNYHQTEGISYTDQQWIFTPMIMVKSVVYYGVTIYRYLLGRSGQTVDPKVKMRLMEHAKRNSYGLLNDFEAYKGEILDPRIKSYLYSRLSWYIKDIYVFYICNYSHINAQILREYDRNVGDISPEIYDFLCRKGVSSYMGFCYLSYWREHDIPIVLVKIIGNLYKMILRFQLGLCSRNNRLSIGN